MALFGDFSVKVDSSVINEALEGLGMLVRNQESANTLIDILRGLLQTAHYVLVCVGHFCGKSVWLLNFCGSQLDEILPIKGKSLVYSPVDEEILGVVIESTSWDEANRGCLAG